jgi:hypothetical protein
MSSSARLNQRNEPFGPLILRSWFDGASAAQFIILHSDDQTVPGPQGACRIENSATATPRKRLREIDHQRASDVRCGRHIDGGSGILPTGSID